MTSLPFNSEFPEPHPIYEDYMQHIDELRRDERHKRDLDTQLGALGVNLALVCYEVAQGDFRMSVVTGASLLGINAVSRAILRRDYQERAQS